MKSFLFRRIAGSAISFAVVLASAGLNSASGARRPIEVRMGRPAFWMGAYDASGSHDHVYVLKVVGGADLLRVGIDVPSRTDWYRVDVFRPTGSRAIRFHKRYAFNAEGMIRSPEPGEWKVVVRSRYVTDSVFRMRAVLQDRKGTSTEGSLLPDLRAIPPFDFTFTAPQDGGGSDYDNDPDPMPPTVLSCAPDEMSDDHVVRCLRFSAGIENAGSGPLDLQFDPADADRRMFQFIHRTGASPMKRRAGHFEWHESHQHFHYENIWTLELLGVTDRSTGEMSPASSGRKSGFCPADQRIAKWRRFDQAPAFSYAGNCGVTYVETATGDFEPVPAKRGTMAFSPGWGDVYGWYRPGNYLDFGTSGDGLYVVRVKVDEEGRVHEASEGNNSSYALIRLSNNEISVLERGRGTDPWDPRKVVIKDWWRRFQS